jgi:hypothetical protein
MNRNVIGAVAVALLLASVAPAAAQRVRTGLLDCDVSGGFGFIIGSQKSVSCVFTPDQQVQPEFYVGTISKFGLDIGATAGSRMVWGVFMESVAFRGAVAGDYIGATGEATVALGLGANVLVGGSNRGIALQPLSVTGQAGLNLAVGVAQLSLRLGR